MASDFDVDQGVRDVSATLQKKLPSKDATEIERVVRAQAGELQDRPVHDPVSVLAQRAAEQQLSAS